MNTLIFILLYIIGAVVLAFYRASLKTATITSASLFLLYILLGSKIIFITIILLVTTVILGILSLRDFRKATISSVIFKWYKRVLPPLSATEQEAIETGTVWWEGELFTGKPQWQKLLSNGTPQLSEKEQAFLDGPAEELCKMLDSWQINHVLADIPPPVMTFIKQQKFLGMIIPEEYGGLGLSAVAQSEVLSKIVGATKVIANLIIVPNSLGPAELLLKYGTETQKQQYLAKLASGDEIPCFALTGPLAGSDATAIPDTGIVCEGEWQGEKIIGMRLNFDKRYITLAPIATLIGLAFKLKDPDHLLGDTEDFGITCALIPRTTPGIEIGRRHYPVGDPFHNGPIRGKDVFVPLDFIIGGIEMAGKGWTMLVNCLSVGRCIMLPGLSNSIAKRTLAATSAYTRIRQQFNLPISQFEGIQKPLAHIAGLSYIINAARLQTAHAITLGEKPAVPASILKYHCTEMCRQILLHAFDIHGGKAIMKGPKNYLAPTYESFPVAITVEGANIMTRNLMIFGQGAIRCHPYTLKEVELAHKGDSESALSKFNDILFEHIGSIYHNGARAFVMAITGSRFEPTPMDTPLKRYYQHINRLSAAFAFTADVAMVLLQASLKRREMLSARLGDLLSMLYLASLVLKQYQDQGNPREDLPVVEWALQYLLNRYQVAMQEIIHNYPNRLVALKLRLIAFPLGQHFHNPPDALETAIARLITHNTETRKRLIAGIFDTPCEVDPVGELNELVVLADVMEPLEKKIRSAEKAGKLAPTLGMARVDAAEKASVLDSEQASQLREYYMRVMAIINVDEFEYSEFSREEQ
jgi:acyl-CoA dehydrogenase